MFKILQMGRGIGALAVALFHLSLAFNDSRFGMSPVFMEWMQLGRHRVEFFFALSGFIILYSHWKDVGEPSRLRLFGVKRLARIYPLYWVALLCMVALALANRKTPFLWWGELLSNVALVKVVESSPLIIPAWTLFHEIFFYFVFASFLMNRLFGFAVFAVWVVLMCALGHAADTPAPGFLAVATNPINLCFLGGMGAFFIYRRVPLAHSTWLSVVGCLFLACALGGVSEFESPLLFYALMSGGIGLFMGGLIGLERQGRIIDVRFFGIMGNASYSIYLFHSIFLIGFLKYAHIFRLKDYLGVPVLFALSFVAVIAASVFVHFYIERPLNRYIGNWLGLKKAGRVEENAGRRSAA